jgi:hypothetical protein
MEQTGRIIEVMEPKSGKLSKTGNPWMIILTDPFLGITKEIANQAIKILK